MKLAIGNDHSAVEMKKEIKKYLEDKDIIEKTSMKYREALVKLTGKDVQ